MPRNVEVKAKIKDFSKSISIAQNLCEADAKIIFQEDTFFNVFSGRLKLRHFQDGSDSQLIYYSRPDTEGPKTSDYSVCSIANHQELLSVLKLALGVKGSIKKKRYLFLYGQTRIHLDQVENLGNFFELEVVLAPEQTIEEAKEIAEKLMQKFEISESDLIKGAYIDHLSKK